MSVNVFDTAEELAGEVAESLLAVIADTQASGDVPQICLTGGTIADAVHRQVAARADASGVDWSAVDFWWGDERFVAHDDADRNCLQAAEAFLNAVGVPGHRRHEVAASDQTTDARAAADDYDRALHAVREFDVVMLGMGPDGHIASLFPGFTQLDVTDRQAVAVTGSPKPPPERVSMTLPRLTRTTRLWLVVDGAGKAEALGKALAGAPPREIPAAAVANLPITTIFADAAAAG